jgi:hypothetical protein
MASVKEWKKFFLKMNQALEECMRMLSNTQDDWKEKGWNAEVPDDMYPDIVMFITTLHEWHVEISQLVYEVLRDMDSWDPHKARSTNLIDRYVVEATNL